MLDLKPEFDHDLVGFDGDYEFVFSSIEVRGSNFTNITQVDTTYGGVVVWPGIDLGICGPQLFEEVIRPLIPSKKSKKLLRSALNIRGSDAVIFLAENASEITQIPPLASTQSEIIERTIRLMLKIFWKRACNFSQRISNSGRNLFSSTSEQLDYDAADPICQTVILLFSIKNPKIPLRALGTLFTNDVLTSDMKLAQELLALESKFAGMGVDVSEEVSHLLENYIPLQDSVGSAGINNQIDVDIIASRLHELGYLDQENFETTNSAIDWSPLELFIDTIESIEEQTCNGVVQPGGLIHLWLSSDNAPKLMELNLYPIVPQPVIACEWYWNTITQLVKQLKRICLWKSEATGQSIEPVLMPHSIIKNGMGFSIALPSKDITPCVNVNDPNFDEEMMSLICQSLLSCDLISDGNSLELNHAGLSTQGFVKLGSSSENLVVKLNRPAISPVGLAESQQESLTQNEIPNSEILALVDPNISDGELYDHYIHVIESVNSGPTIDFNTLEVLHLLGITGWVGRQHVPNTKDEYNDTIIALWKNAQGQKIVKEYVASTSPGTYKKYYNVKGDAHLVSGRYAYKRGKHKGYDALVQAESFTVWRDFDKDGRRKDDSIVENGYFGINIHAAGTGTKVGNWSAGCQVIWGGRGHGSPFETFMQDVHSLVGSGDTVYYTLVDSSLVSEVFVSPNNGGGQ
jgi:hypothetical protein